MRLVYINDPTREVKVGDTATTGNGGTYVVEAFSKPHKPAASGRVTVRWGENGEEYSAEYYVGVIGAEWIEREDRN